MPLWPAGASRGYGSDLAAGLARHSAVRVPRTTAIVRRAARAARMNRLTSAPLIAVLNDVIAPAGRLGPNLILILRSFTSVADWGPPQQPYAAGAELAQRASGMSGRGDRGQW